MKSLHWGGFLFGEKMKQGKALKHNVGIAKWYYDELDEMTEEMTSET